jgi:hypothetical protein
MKFGYSVRLTRVLLAGALLASFLAKFKGIGFHEGW